MYTSSKGPLCSRAAVLAAIAGVSIWCASASEPELLWSYEAQSNLYPSPLVADVHPSPGLETIISDSEVREVLCVDTKGELLWRYAGGWTRRLTSGASLSFTARNDAGTLLIGNSDGKLCCVDAATGQELWTRSVGPIEWGTAIWADLDGDSIDEAVAGTQNAIVALTAAGNPLWTRDAFEERPVNISGPIAAADLDGDGRAEIVALDQYGPFCIGYNGEMRWIQTVGDQFQGAPVIAQLVSDGPAAILALSGNGDFVYCFDALNGKSLWKRGILGSPDAYAAGGLAVGDIDGDGSMEIIAPDNFGHVHCIDRTGTLRWVFTTDKATHSAASMGDVDGDGEIEILVASGDHNLYCVDAHGRLEWKYQTGLRLIRPATITDIDGDGRTDILFGGSDRTLRCLTLGGRYDPVLIPWPTNRANIAQTGSTLNRDTATTRLVSTTRELIDNGDFRRAEPRSHDGNNEPPTEVRVPVGWREESLNAKLRWTASGGRDNSPCAIVLPDATDTVFASRPIPIDAGLVRVDARVFVTGNNPEAVSACLRWMGDRGELRVDALQSAAGPEGWQALAGADIQPPENAEWVQLVCTTPASDTEIRWDDATIMAHYDERPLIKPAVNQVGYDIGAPKRFTAWSNFVGESPATFALVNESGTVAFEGELIHEGRITGAYGNDWGNEYWRGDFSAFDEPGTYRVRVTIDEASGESWPFAISEDRIWAKTAEPAYQFFYYQRCGMEVPGFHGACHLDDAVSPDGERQYSLSGGWHDAGDYNTYNNAPYVYGLLRAYEARTDAFNAIDRDGNGQSDFLDEISWGADLMRRMIAPDGSSRGDISSGYGFWGPPELETDNIPNTGDERRIRGAESGNDPANHLAAAAKIARFVEPNDAYVEAAKQAFAWRAERGSRDARQLSAALDLYTLTGEAAYADAARALLPEVGYGDAAIVERYDEIFNEDHSAQVRDAYVARADAILALANNPFGVYMYGAPDNPTFFGTPPETGGWHVGNSSHVLEAASTVAIAFRYTGDPRYLAFVYDQLNWILGNNPYDLCLMEGVGSRHPPTYHHRYTMAGVPRGAVPGSVVNGITWRAPGDDRPHFDMRGLDIPDFEPNEVWLPHNTAYLNALANLQRAHRERGEIR